MSKYRQYVLSFRHKARVKDGRTDRQNYEYDNKTARPEIHQLHISVIFGYSEFDAGLLGHLACEHEQTIEYEL